MAKLPQHPVSFVVQFKRPEYLQGSGAAQYHYWNQPYFRFTRSKGQHSVLRGLERSLLGSAVVRYASPAFHRVAELEHAQLRGHVVDSTGFVSPVRLGRHATWTYISPGTVGRGNPDGEEMPFAIFDALFSAVRPEARGELVAVGGLREHLALLAQACREVAATRSRRVDAWIADVSQTAVVSPRSRPAARLHNRAVTCCRHRLFMVALERRRKSAGREVIRREGPRSIDSTRPCRAIVHRRYPSLRLR